MQGKIVFLINSLTSGGAERVLSIILTVLKKQNFDIELICIEKNNFYKIPDDIKVTYLSNNMGNENAIVKLLQLPFLALKLKKHIKKNDIKIIQSHVYRANYVNALAKFFGANHKIQMVNAGQVSMYKNKGFVGIVNLFLIKKLYPIADTIICKSKGMEIDLQSYFKIKIDTVIINNPYDIEKINSLKNEEVDDFTFNKDKKYLIYVGRFASFKKPEYVIESLSKLNEKTELLLLGDGPNKENLEKLVDLLSLNERVHFLGRVQNPYKYIAKANIFILSSEDGEGFPNVLAESMICKTAVISTDCKSGPREILAPDTDVTFQLKNNIEITNHGILVPIGDIDLMVEAINIILEDDKLHDKFIENAYARSLDFSLNKIITKYKKVLELE